MALPLMALLGLLGGGGAALGGLLGGRRGTSKFLMGEPERERQFQRFTPEQESALSQLLHQGMETTGFEGMEGLARKRFTEETIPSIAERFTAMGDGQRSSAFESSIGRAGSDLESQLAALRSQQGMQKLGMGLQPRFETAYQQATPGFGQQLGGSLVGSLPMLLQLLYGGR